MLDFSAYEKAVLGWIPAQPHVTVAKRYVLAPPTARSTLAQALVMDTEDGSWWIEYRAKPFRGLLVRFVESREPAALRRSAALMLQTRRRHIGPGSRAVSPTGSRLLPGHAAEGGPGPRRAPLALRGPHRGYDEARGRDG